MGDAPPPQLFSFGALRKTFGPLFVRCDVFRRHVQLALGTLRDLDYRTETFSCSRCGAAGSLAIMDPTTEAGMEDYRLDPVGDPVSHPAAVVRLPRAARRTAFATGGELPGRKINGRR